MRSLELRVTRAEEGERLDRFIAAKGNISRGLARRALETGGVFLEGKRCKVASRQVRAGQAVTVHLEEGGRAGEAPVPLAPSRLLFADADLCAAPSPSSPPRCWAAR